MKLVYCGFGRVGLECLYQLLSGFLINIEDLIIFTHKTDENKDFLKHLEYNGIRFYIDSINKHISLVEDFHPEFLLSVYYRDIVKEDILKLVNYRAMNLHPSLLPRYRGTKSSVWAILNKEKYTGISFHLMNAKIDDGRILYQEKMEIHENDTAYSLYHKLAALFIRNFSMAFQRLIDHFEGYEQEGESSTYRRELPFGGVRMFEDISYEEACQFVKAMYFPPHKGALFRMKNGREIEVLNVQELVRYRALFKGNR